MATCLYLAILAILNGGLAILIVSCDQVRYWQRLQPTSRPTFTGFTFPVRNDT